ncbi:hypothetical protein ACFOPQ_10105 [Deinococcus antarcticus]|uniref:YD repeat-containing protein n=1 Tax=Deinococcus antarcticus TaxID=1298767 RepID=A0ABV8A6X1_9DEIO
MPELTDAGKVERRADGSLVFTHGHRFPDNTQRVVQEYDASGRLTGVQVELTGFAGKVLDVRATVDEQGKVLQEEGYRAPEVTTPVQEFIRILPAEAGAGAPEMKAQAVPGEVTPAPADVSGGHMAVHAAGTDGIRAGLERIYGPLKS